MTTSNSGIYAIVSSINECTYIGSAVNFRARWNNHRYYLRRGSHHNSHLQRAWDKYGEEAFDFVVLEECNLECLIEREQHYLDITPNKYNLAPTAGSWLGRTHSMETRAKMSASMTGVKRSAQARANISAAARGRKATPEAKAKMSKAQKGRTHTEETKEKIRQANIGRKQTPETRAKISAARKGKTASPEARTKISESLIGNTRTLGHKHSDETRAKMSAAHQRRLARQQVDEHPPDTVPESNLTT